MDEYYWIIWCKYNNRFLERIDYIENEKHKINADVNKKNIFPLIICDLQINFKYEQVKNLSKLEYVCFRVKVFYSRWSCHGVIITSSPNDDLKSFQLTKYMKTMYAFAIWTKARWKWRTLNMKQVYNIIGVHIHLLLLIFGLMPGKMMFTL